MSATPAPKRPRETAHQLTAEVSPLWNASTSSASAASADGATASVVSVSGSRARERRLSTIPLMLTLYGSLDRLRPCGGWTIITLLMPRSTPTRFVVLTSPRSGSTWFVDTLNRAPAGNCVPAPAARPCAASGASQRRRRRLLAGRHRSSLVWPCNRPLGA